MILYGKKYGGADPQLIEGDNFRMIISIPEFGENPAKNARIVPAEQIAGQVAGQVTGQVVALLKICLNEMNRSELMNAVKLKGRDNFLKKYLEPALDLGLIEMTQPDSPKSPTQKYRLTEKGKKVLASGKPKITTP